MHLLLLLSDGGGVDDDEVAAGGGLSINERKESVCSGGKRIIRADFFTPRVQQISGSAISKA